VELKRWLPLFVVGIIFGVVMRVSLLVTFLLVLLIVLSLASWWQRRSLVGVNYLRKPHYKRAFPGEIVPLRIEIENRKLLPLTWLRVQDPWPKAVGPEQDDVLAPTHRPDQGLLTHVFSLRWYERARRYYRLKFRKRGVYQIGPVRLESGDLFGIFERSEEREPVELLTVFPDLIPFADLQLPADDPFGDRRSRRRLYEDQNQPIGVRDYLPEDSFRKVHWPATAHTGQLQVKVYQPTSANIMVVCLNVSTFARHWEGTNPELLEHVIKVAATLATKGIEDGYRVGLIANGCLAHADQPFRIPPGRSPKQLASLLEALAGVTPVVTGPFENFLLKQVPRVSYGATLLIVTSITNPELFETLVQLRQHGRQITLLSFAEQPPQQVPGIRTIHLPFVPETAN
jgi:uncharacterized protein (DUF58 family)